MKNLKLAQSIVSVSVSVVQDTITDMRSKPTCKINEPEMVDYTIRGSRILSKISAKLGVAS